MEKLRQTPSQTVGPFFAYSLTAVQYGYDYNSILDGLLLGDNDKEDRIYVTGCIFDGNGNAISDAMIELWQADASGNYITEYPSTSGRFDREYRQAGITPHLRPDLIGTTDGQAISFKGFGRLGTGTSADHRFTFTTIKPGSINGSAPHINVIIFMRGSLRTLFTRIYFSDEANDNDPFLNAVDAARRKTLIATKQIEGQQIYYYFDIHLQGEKETVFFDV